MQRIRERERKREKVMKLSSILWVFGSHNYLAVTKHSCHNFMMKTHARDTYLRVQPFLSCLPTVASRWERKDTKDSGMWERRPTDGFLECLCHPSVTLVSLDFSLFLNLGFVFSFAWKPRWERNATRVTTSSLSLHEVVILFPAGFSISLAAGRKNGLLSRR